MELRSLLILIQVPAIFVLILIMCLVSMLELNNNMDDWTSQVNAHVVREEKNHILDVTENVARFTQLRWERIAADVIIQRDYARRIFSAAPDITVSSAYTTYNVEQSVDAGNGVTGSPTNKYDSCVWWNLDNSVAASETILSKSTGMDNIYRAGRDATMYITRGFANEANNFVRMYPFFRDTTLRTLSYHCYSAAIGIGAATGWKPRCREWYVKAAANVSRVIFPAPIIDAVTKKVIITVSAAVVDLSDLTTLRGVVFADIDLSSFETDVNKNQILGGDGWPFLVDNETGQLLIWPNLKRDKDYYVRDLHGFASAQEASAFESIFNTSAGQAMIHRTTQTFSYTRAGEPFFGTVAPVNETNMLVGVVVPEAAIRRAVNSVTSTANTGLVIALVIAICVLVALVVIAVIMNIMTSTEIDNDINDLNDLLREYAQGRFDAELFRTNGDDVPPCIEFYRIRESFHGLAVAVQFSNPEALVNVESKLAVALHLEQVLNARENRRGLGVVRNNISIDLMTLDPNNVYNGCTTAAAYNRSSIADGRWCLEHINDPRKAHVAGPQQHSEARPTLNVMHGADFGVAVEMANQGPQRAVRTEDLRRAINSRTINSAIVAYRLRDPTAREQFEACIRSSQELDDIEGIVAAMLQHAACMDAAQMYAEADQVRAEIVNKALDAVRHSFRDESLTLEGMDVERLRQAASALATACLSIAMVRTPGNDWHDPAFQSFMHQYYNLALLTSCLVESHGLPPIDRIVRVFMMMTYFNRARAQEIVMRFFGNRPMNPQADLDAVSCDRATGPVATAESLIGGGTVSSVAQGDFYNMEAVNGDFQGAAVDEHGNPLGTANELAVDGAYAGFRILIFLGYEMEGMGEALRGPVATDLAIKGFEINIVTNHRDFIRHCDPRRYHVAWIISTMECSDPAQERELVSAGVLNEHSYRCRDPANFIECVRRFHEYGRGLFLMADNQPFVYEANLILGHLFGGIRLGGNTPGGRIIGPGNPTQGGHFNGNHLLFTGIHRIHEGETLSYPNTLGDFELLGTSSNHQPLFFCRNAPNIRRGPGRVVVDCAYTKTSRRSYTDAGNARYLSNCSAWLCLRERPEPGKLGARAMALLAQAQVQANHVPPVVVPEYDTLRTRIIKRLGTVYVILLTVAFCVLIGVCIGTVHRVRDDLEEVLSNQVHSHSALALRGASNSFAEDLDTAAAIVNSSSTFGGDIYTRGGSYSNAIRTSDYDLGGTTAAGFLGPLETIHGLAQQSRSRSSWYVKGVTGNQASLTGAQQSEADKTSHLDPLLYSAFASHIGKFFSLYSGHPQPSPSSGFRRMPALSTASGAACCVDASRTYDPVGRTWYTDAAATSATVVSAPYQDAASKRWMITFSKRMTATPTSSGVAGADILLEQLTKRISQLKLLTSGKVTVFEKPASGTDPIVVGDEEFAVTSVTQTTQVKASELRSPAVHSGMRDFILGTSSTGSGRSAVFETTYRDRQTTVTYGNQQFLMSVVRVSGYGDKFFIVAFVRSSEAFAPLHAILDSIKAVEIVIAVVCTIVFVAAVVAAFVLIFITSSLITSPVHVIEANVVRLIDNVGKKDITEGVMEIDAENAAYASAAALSYHFNMMTEALRDAAGRQQHLAATLGWIDKLGFISVSPVDNEEFPECARDLAAMINNDLRSRMPGV